MSANSLFFSPKRKRLSSFDPTQAGPTSEKESDDGIMKNVEYQTDDEKEDESVFYHRHRIRNSPSENNTTVMGHGSSFRSPAKFPSKISEPGSLVKSAILKGSFADGETWLTTNCSYSHEESEDMDENYSRLLSSSCQEQDSRQRLCLTKEKHSLNWLTEDINSFTRSCDLYNDDDKDDNSVTGLRKQFGTPILSHSRLADELRDSPHSPEPRSFSLTDFGTPVAKVGSPSVLDGLDCPISMEEDSVMDLSTERNEHPVSAVDSVQTESFLKLAEPCSPSGVQHVSDLSALVPQLHHNNTRKKRCSGYLPLFISYFYTFNLIPRTLLPLPDLAAFDTSKAKFELEKDSPVCPPTPLRTPFSSIFTVAEPEFSIPLLRQNSLEDNKLLLSQSESPRGGEIIFLRDFIIEGIIGTGAFAEVYKVRPRNASTLQSFAVKKIKRQFRSRKDRDWLLNEVKMMKKVGLNACRNIVPFVRAWQEDSYFYVQLGLAEKGSLKDFLLALISKRELVPDLTLWHVFLDCICGLSHIHQCGIVHLDIKPANLLIDSEGRVLIGDFGMASEIGSKEDGHEGDTRFALFFFPFKLSYY
jgi:tRNA A-37 threonylcarbamoyl transferase component Bud32